MRLPVWLTLLAGLGASAALGSTGCACSSEDDETGAAADDSGVDAQPDADASDAAEATGDVVSEAEAEAEDAADASDAGDVEDASDDGDAALPLCSSCHGGLANAAPPVDTQGKSATTGPGVGAHQAHLDPSTLFRTVECADCHVVPTNAGDPGHIDSLPAELTWGAIATADAVAAKYENGKCSLYCHGASLAGGSNTAPIWTKVDGSQASCGDCHGLPPPPPHPKLSGSGCSPCHPNFNGAKPVNPSLHVNGKVEVAKCGTCHAMPPATGSHVRHYGDTSAPALAAYGDVSTVADYLPAGASYYMFGCGNCHPLDVAKHANGTTEVELHSAGAPANSLKAKTPASAVYSAGKCNNVYCHSSGQATPTYVETPAWNGGSLAGARCAACHANPPKYPTGGAGSATANTHVVLADDGWELGHFGGMPGPWHTSYHGGATQKAAPMTCQTCHYDSVDPSNVGPGGFYYLDTTGNYDQGGALKYACGTCHTGASGQPATKTGEIRSVLHVNGRRDVKFDPRTSIPTSVTGIPTGSDRPTYPYWVTAIPSPLPPASVVNGTTWSLNLAGASYDPVKKTCANVPCHLKQSFGTGKPLYEPLTWGLTPVGYASCSACHQL